MFSCAKLRYLCFCVLKLLRTSLVNHRTQATICDDLGMTEYVINNDQKVRERMENEKNKVKDKADILEGRTRVDVINFETQ